MAVPKKRTSMSKKCIRRNIWKKKGYLAVVKAFSLADISLKRHKFHHVHNSIGFIKN